MGSRGSLLGAVLVLGGLVYFAAPIVTGHHSAGQAPATTDIAVGSSEASWISSLLTSLGDPHTAANDNSIADWILHESVGWPPQACTPRVVTNNPINTTLTTGADLSHCIPVYPSLQVGLQNTVTTLHNGHYGDILAQLGAGAGLQSGASSGLRTWSNGAYGSV